MRAIAGCAIEATRIANRDALVVAQAVANASVTAATPWKTVQRAQPQRHALPTGSDRRRDRLRDARRRLAPGRATPWKTMQRAQPQRHALPTGSDRRRDRLRDARRRLAPG